MLFEVHIPTQETDGYDETLTVDAENWMAALKSGLERTGEPDADMRGIMCDIKDDNSIHVTDTRNRRVFVLKELDAEADEEVQALRQEAAQAHQREAETPTPPQQPSPPKDDPSWVSDDGRMRVGSATHKALQAQPHKEATVLRQKRAKSGQRPAVQVGRAHEKISENILEDIFLEIQSIHEEGKPMEQVVKFIMDLAMEKIPAESGAILFADVNGRELYFATARGPKSDDVMGFRIPMGQGIVGFCAREGVSLAIGDAQRDPRFYRQISDALNYPTTSIVCAPIQFEGRVYGCIELMNKSTSDLFSVNEVNALGYIGSQFAEFINRLVMSREKL